MKLQGIFSLGFSSYVLKAQISLHQLLHFFFLLIRLDLAELISWDSAIQWYAPENEFYQLAFMEQLIGLH
jgi:hypothetical protein